MARIVIQKGTSNCNKLYGKFKPKNCARYGKLSRMILTINPIKTPLACMHTIRSLIHTKVKFTMNWEDCGKRKRIVNEG